MSYAIYLRKSRADVEMETGSDTDVLQRHKTLLLELARRNEHCITDIYKEVVSGDSIAARPQMQKLLSAVENGCYSGVYVVDVDRLARGDTIDQGIVAQTFKYSDTLIITPIKVYNPNNEFDEEYFEFGLFMSRREYKTINRRLQRGRLASVKEGKWVANKAPFGYERVKIPNDKGYTLAPLQPEADIVKLIFKLYTEGEENPDGSFERMGVARIVRKLNNMGAKPRVADHWSPASVRDMMRNPVYMGKIRWNSRASKKSMVDGNIEIVRKRVKNSECVVTEGLHPALVSEETFNIAQDYLDSNRKRPLGESGKLTNPLAGLVYCSKCGHAMVRRPYDRPGSRASLMCHDTACDNIGSYFDIVEERILDALRDWVENYKTHYAAPDASPGDESLQIKERTLAHLIAEYGKLNKQLDMTHDLLEQGVYSTDQFLERSRKVSVRLKENEDARRALQQEMEEDRKREASRSQIVPKVEHLLAVYDVLPSATEKNEMLKEVLEKVVYLKERRARRKTDRLDDFEITIYPKIPKY